MDFNPDVAPTNNSIYIRLGDGDAVEGVTVGNEQAFVHPEWNAWRFRVNFAVRDNNENVVRILEGGKQVYGQLKELHDTGYDLTRTRIRVSRKGSGQYDTEYKVTPLPNGNLNDDEVATLNALERHDLAYRDSNNEATVTTTDVPF